MKKLLFIALLVVSVLLSSFALVACEEDTTVTATLDAPVIALSGNVISWSAVADATSYEVYCDSVSAVVQSGTSYTIDKTAEGSYSYYVIASATIDSVSVKSSKSNTVTYTVSGSTEDPDDGGVVTPVSAWSLSSILEDATLGYIFNATVSENYDTNMSMEVTDHDNAVDNKLMITLTNTGSLDLFVKAKVEFDGSTDQTAKYAEIYLDAGETITVLVDVSDITAEKIFLFPDLGAQEVAGEASFTVDACEFCSIIELDKPVVVLDTDVISWSAVEGAAGYDIYCNGALVTSVTDTSYTLLDTEEGLYTYSVVATTEADGYVDSQASNDISYTVGSPVLADVSLGTWTTTDSEFTLDTTGDSLLSVSYTGVAGGTYKNVYAALVDYNVTNTVVIVTITNTSDSAMSMRVGLDDGGTAYGDYNNCTIEVAAGETAEFRLDISVSLYTPTSIKLYPDTDSSLKADGSFTVDGVVFYTAETAPELEVDGMLGDWDGNWGATVDSQLGFVFTATVDAESYGVGIVASIIEHSYEDNNRIAIVITNTSSVELSFKARVDFEGSEDSTAKYGELTLAAGATGTMYINIDDQNGTKLTIFPDMGTQTEECTASFTVDEVYAYYDEPVAPAEQLGTPVVSIEGNTISWDAVDNAGGYNIFIDGVWADHITATSYTVTTEGTYTVVAQDYNEVYADSNASNGVEYTAPVVATPAITSVTAYTREDIIDDDAVANDGQYTAEASVEGTVITVTLTITGELTASGEKTYLAFGLYLYDNDTLLVDGDVISESLAYDPTVADWNSWLSYYSTDRDYGYTITYNGVDYTVDVTVVDATSGDDSDDGDDVVATPAITSVTAYTREDIISDDAVANDGQYTAEASVEGTVITVTLTITGELTASGENTYLAFGLYLYDNDTLLVDGDVISESLAYDPTVADWNSWLSYYSIDRDYGYTITYNGVEYTVDVTVVDATSGDDSDDGDDVVATPAQPTVAVGTYTFDANGAGSSDGWGINTWIDVAGHDIADYNTFTITITNNSSIALVVCVQGHLADNGGSVGASSNITIAVGESATFTVTLSDSIVGIIVFPNLGTEVLEGASFTTSDIAFSYVEATAQPTIEGWWAGDGVTLDDSLGFVFTTTDGEGYGVSMGTNVFNHDIADFTVIEIVITNTGDTALTIGAKACDNIDATSTDYSGDLTLAAGETGTLTLYINTVSSVGFIQLFPDKGAVVGSASMTIDSVTFC